MEELNSQTNESSVAGGPAERWRSSWTTRLALGIVILCGVSLRLVGAAAECRINWDEGRPDVERVIESPRVLIDLFEQSWGRPGLVLMKCIGLIMDRGLVKCGLGATLPDWIPFQITLDLLTLLVITWAANRMGNTGSTTQRRNIAILCAALWACSPGAIYWSHRFMAPTYAMLGVAVTIALLQQSRSVPTVIGVAGAAAGFTFLVYPGTYVLLASLGLAYSFNRSDLMVSLRRFTCFVIGIAVPLIVFEIGLRVASSYGTIPADYFTQLTQLSGTINHGNYQDALFAVWTHITRFGDWVFAGAIVMLGLGLLKSRFSPAGVALAITWTVWIINSTVLHREVLYDRVLVLVTPVLIIAVGELACLARRNATWTTLMSVTAVVFGPIVTYSVISNWELIRIREADVRRFVAQSKHQKASNIRLIADVHDYGPMADAHESELLEKLKGLSRRSDFDNSFVVFNLRSDCYIKPDVSRTERYATAVLLRLPAQGLDQDGRGRRFLSLTAKEPCRFGLRFDDIKLFPASELLRELQIRKAAMSASRSRNDMDAELNGALR